MLYIEYDNRLLLTDDVKEWRIWEGFEDWYMGIYQLESIHFKVQSEAQARALLRALPHLIGEHRKDVVMLSEEEFEEELVQKAKSRLLWPEEDE